MVSKGTASLGHSLQLPVLRLHPRLNWIRNWGMRPSKLCLNKPSENHCSRTVVFTVCSMDCCYQNQVGLVKQHFCLRVLDTDLSPMLSVVGLLFGTVLERIISLVLSPWGIDIFLVFQLPHILVFFFLGLCLLLFRY